MKRMFAATGAAMALALATPLSAETQTSQAEAEMAELEEAMGAMSELFKAEPLTQEQEARLPQTERIVALMIPDGAMAEIMGDMIDDIMGPIMTMGGSGAKASVARAIGVTPFEINLDEETAAEIAALFDPAWVERQEAELGALPMMMREVMTLMEPGLRKAMSEAYAVRFTEGELDEIEAFFATETGAKYARESFAMASDPRMMSASMEAMPAMMGIIGDMETRIKESTADLPEPRSYDALSDAERQKVIEATGFTDEEIRAALGAEGSGDDWEDAWSEDPVEEPATE